VGAGWCGEICLSLCYGTVRLTNDPLSDLVCRVYFFSRGDIGFMVAFSLKQISEIKRLARSIVDVFGTMKRIVWQSVIPSFQRTRGPIPAPALAPDVRGVRRTDKQSGMTYPHPGGRGQPRHGLRRPISARQEVRIAAGDICSALKREFDLPLVVFEECLVDCKDYGSVGCFAKVHTVS
jgi:hypothetical protein